MNESDSELSIRREMLTCKHFNGIQHDACRAGVNYRTLAGEPAFGMALRLPCLPVELRSKSPECEKVKCEQRQFPTRQEAEAQEAKHQARLANFSAAHKAAKADAKAKGYKRDHGGNSELKCPVCPDGTLHYSVASYNGHMHACCST